MAIQDPTKLAFQAGAAGATSLGAGVQQAAGSIAEARRKNSQNEIELINSLVKGGFATPTTGEEQSDFNIAGLDFKLEQPGMTLLEQFNLALKQAQIELTEARTEKLRQAPEKTDRPGKTLKDLKDSARLKLTTTPLEGQTREGIEGLLTPDETRALGEEIDEFIPVGQVPEFEEETQGFKIGDKDRPFLQFGGGKKKITPRIQNAINQIRTKADLDDFLFQTQKFIKNEDLTQNEVNIIKEYFGVQ